MNIVKIIYWSATGNTKLMANAISDAMSNINETDVEVVSVENVRSDMISKSTHLILGCPSMGAEVLEETEFEPFIDSNDFTGKKVALFGSYGWGDGEWMRNWETQMTDEKSAKLIIDSLIINETPDDNGIKLCHEFGKSILNI